MQKIDRLGWAAGIAFVLHGARIGIRVNDLRALSRLEALLPPGWKAARSPTVPHLYSLRVGRQRPGSSIRSYHLLYSGAARISRSLDLEKVLETLERELPLTVAALAKRRVFVHAGVVGWKGRAILLPGRSYSGKSTLVQALVEAGATYYSDEFAVVDATGRVHAYARDLGLRDPGSTRTRAVSVEDLGGRRGSTPLPVGLVLVSQFRPDGRWRPRRLSAARGALALLGHTVTARLEPETALTTLTKAVQHARVLQGARGEAHDVARWLLRIAEEKAA